MGSAALPGSTADGTAIDGQAASLPDAIAAAGRILGRSRMPVIAGLGTDIAGAEAAILLAQRIGAALDHMHADAALRDLDAMRTAGWIVTTPGQARARADLLLLIGPGIPAAWPGIWQHLRPDAAPSLKPGQKRRVFRLCPGNDPAPPATKVETIGSKAEELAVLLGILRALASGRGVAPRALQVKSLGACAAALKAAQYAVVIWAPQDMNGLAVEMICGLIDDLNGSTRCAGLPVAPPDNAAGIVQALAWRTGFPVRVGFGGAAPEHDPWRFAAGRMVESGEADAAVWISALTPAAPPWSRPVPTVALVAPGTRFAKPPAVTIAVGRPGTDHAGVLFAPETGALAFRPVRAVTGTPRVAKILQRIADAAGASC